MDLGDAPTEVTLGDVGFENANAGANSNTDVIHLTHVDRYIDMEPQLQPVQRRQAFAGVSMYSRGFAALGEDLCSFARLRRIRHDVQFLSPNRKLR